MPAGAHTQPTRPSQPSRDGRFSLDPWLRRIRSAWFVAATLVAACAGPAAHDAGGGRSGALRAIDDAGDTVVLRRPPSRIVSLEPSVTELLFALGDGPLVVGRTRWCDYPAAARAVPVVADAIQPSVEAVAAARPDLVVLYPSESNASAVDRLHALGIAVFQARTDRIEDVPRLAKLLGRLTNRRAAADSVAAAFTAALDSVTVRRVPAPSVFLLVWDQPPMTVGRGSFLSELLSRAGARNVFDDLAASSAPVSIEAVAARNPDLVLTTAASGTPEFARRPEWQVVPAVRARRFIHISGSQFDHPGPRIPAAIAQLSHELDQAGW